MSIFMDIGLTPLCCLQQTDTLMASVLGETEPGALVEVALYFRESFGNQTRIDYGSGTP